MNQAASSIASGCKSPQMMVDQTPAYDSKRFNKRPRPGRPRKKDKRQYWVR